MSKNYSQYPNYALRKRTLAVATVAGGLAALLTGCESAPSAADAPPPLASAAQPNELAFPPNIEVGAYVDCKKEPQGTAVVTAQPGRLQFQRFGDAEKLPSGDFHWISDFVLAQHDTIFTIATGGNGVTRSYETAPHSKQPNFVQGQHFPIVTTLANPQKGTPGNYVDAEVVRFKIDDPLSFDNAIAITFHCGTPQNPTPSSVARPF